LATFEFRRPQIKVEPYVCTAADQVCELLQQAVYGLGIPGISVVRSSHSMDVLAPGVSKMTVVERVMTMRDSGASTDVLCIGDRGQWPGNDFSLLSQRYALSVDEVSSDPATCWNLAFAGSRCVEACLEYLSQSRCSAGRIRFARSRHSGAAR
jgi:hypothetical protein